MAFEDWKKEVPEVNKHLSEEEIACFLEGKLDRKDEDKVKAHLAICDACAQIVVTDLSLFPTEEIPVPEELLERARGLVTSPRRAPVLDIVLRMKTFGFSIINTTGDILCDQEFIPAAVLRSRNIQDFKNEVVVLKDFSESRIEVKVQGQAGLGFNVLILARNKKTQRVLKDVRISLFKDDVELESRVADAGRAVFEHVFPGLYSIVISDLKEQIAQIVLEVRV